MSTNQNKIKSLQDGVSVSGNIWKQNSFNVTQRNKIDKILKVYRRVDIQCIKKQYPIEGQWWIALN